MVFNPFVLKGTFNVYSKSKSSGKYRKDNGGIRVDLTFPSVEAKRIDRTMVWRALYLPEYEETDSMGKFAAHFFKSQPRLLCNLELRLSESNALTCHGYVRYKDKIRELESFVMVFTRLFTMGPRVKKRASISKSKLVTKSKSNPKSKPKSKSSKGKPKPKRGKSSSQSQSLVKRQTRLGAAEQDVDKKSEQTVLAIMQGPTVSLIKKAASAVVAIGVTGTGSVVTRKIVERIVDGIAEGVASEALDRGVKAPVTELVKTAKSEIQDYFNSEVAKAAQDTASKLPQSKVPDAVSELLKLGKKDWNEFVQEAASSDNSFLNYLKHTPAMSA
ncbi:MAG: hypothetical protein ACTSUE_14445, partial [Promethearchaeota archaeon]